MKDLPIACTLGAAEGQLRLRQWGRLGERAMLSAHLADRTLTVAYRAAALTELLALVGAERNCCAFLDWALEEGPDRAVLTVRSDANGEPELARLAVLFSASG